MTRTRSRSGRISSSITAGVAGLIATPARRPALDLLHGPVQVNAPLPGERSACRPRPRRRPRGTGRGCRSSGALRAVAGVTGLSHRTMTGPKVRLGTKWPSITSTWIRSAPPCSASATCSARRATSAERIEGASLIAVSPRRGIIIVVPSQNLGHQQRAIVECGIAVGEAVERLPGSHHASPMHPGRIASEPREAFPIQTACSLNPWPR